MALTSYSRIHSGYVCSLIIFVYCAPDIPWPTPPTPSPAVQWRGVQAELKARRLLNLFDASVQANRRSRGADQQHVDDDDDASYLTDQNRQLLDVSVVMAAGVVVVGRSV